MYAVMKQIKHRKGESMTRRVVLERWKKGLSQAALAREIGCNASSMSRIESGKEPPYPLRSKRIAEALGWTGDPSELFEEAEEDE
jgi:transcriptional regulator with XRE-family HTH domain